MAGRQGKEGAPLVDGHRSPEHEDPLSCPAFRPPRRCLSPAQVPSDFLITPSLTQVSPTGGGGGKRR